MTILATTDVNEAFAQTRADQFAAAQAARAAFDQRIADGKLTPLGNGRFQVTDPDSYDNGEVLQRQADGQILPLHGLDTTTGSVALYSTTPAWHSLGNIIPGGLSDIDEVLKLGGINYTVSPRPVMFQATSDSEPTILADQFVNIREDTNAGLAVVGKGYTVIQNRQAFEFLQDLVDDFGVTWESAGALRDGRKVFVCLRLPRSIIIDAEGVHDEILPFLASINSHDGSSLFQVVATPWRIQCGNTERFSVRDAFTRWGVRHTTNATSRIEEARRTLRLSINYYEQFRAEEEALAQTELALAEYHQVIEDLWPTPEEGAPVKAKNNHARRTEALNELWATNTANLGRTAYAAERAITEFADWKSAIRPTGSLRGNNLAARATAALEGSADDLKTKAHKRLLLTVGRR